MTCNFPFFQIPSLPSTPDSLPFDSLQIITLVLGLVILIVSFVATYFINAKAHVLFSTSGDSETVAY